MGGAGQIVLTCCGTILFFHHALQYSVYARHIASVAECCRIRLLLLCIYTFVVVIWTVTAPTVVEHERYNEATLMLANNVAPDVLVPTLKTKSLPQWC